MAEINIEDMEPEKYPLNPSAKDTLRLLVPGVSERIANECVNFVAALRPEVATLIKKAYFMLENLWETYMSSGKVNPVAGIFLGKNNYGYQDKTEYVLTPNQQSDNDYDADEIRERYIVADQQKRLSDNSTMDEGQSD